MQSSLSQYIEFGGKAVLGGLDVVASSAVEAVSNGIAATLAMSLVEAGCGQDFSDDWKFRRFMVCCAAGALAGAYNSISSQRNGKFHLLPSMN